MNDLVSVSSQSPDDEEKERYRQNEASICGAAYVPDDFCVNLEKARFQEICANNPVFGELYKHRRHVVMIEKVTIKQIVMSLCRGSTLLKDLYAHRKATDLSFSQADPLPAYFHTFTAALPATVEEFEHSCPMSQQFEAKFTLNGLPCLETIQVFFLSPQRVILHTRALVA
jgi:hypothetical protein